MTQKEIMEVLDNNPALMEVLENYHKATTQASKADQMDADEKEDAFLDMICNPLFWFERWMDTMTEDPEGLRREVEGLKGGFFQRYSNLGKNSWLADVYVGFAFGFGAGADMVRKIIEK